MSQTVTSTNWGNDPMPRLMSKRPDVLFQWMLEKAAEKGIADAGDLTDMMLLLLLAAIHT